MKQGLMHSQTLWWCFWQELPSAAADGARQVELIACQCVSSCSGNSQVEERATTPGIAYTAGGAQQAGTTQCMCGSTPRDCFNTQCCCKGRKASYGSNRLLH
jgi:hypothetical protein